MKGRGGRKVQKLTSRENNLEGKLELSLSSDFQSCRNDQEVPKQSQGQGLIETKQTKGGGESREGSDEFR